MFFLIFVGLFVKAVGFIKLLIKKWSKNKEEIETNILWTKDIFSMFYMVNKGDSAITPANGRPGFYCSNANTNKHPKPWLRIYVGDPF